MSLTRDSELEKQIAAYFIKRSHHENISVAYLAQNLFNDSKTHRTISLNSHYLFLLKNLTVIQFFFIFDNNGPH